MNKRIQELANSAGFVYVKDEGIGWAGQYNSSLSLFAELIVRECAAYIFVLDAEPVSHKSAAKMLLDHFGVE
jgi:hypothetical protein